jgi:predicted NBD/HSP70 family sugar kinase
VEPAKPSQELVRSLTDEHVLRALMQHRRLTRAELATEIGISKPTAGESVRRLAERGLVADTGERTPGGRGKGRVGSYYALAPTVGVALAITIAPEGVVAECLDVYGDTAAHAVRQIDRPAHPHQVVAALEAAVGEATKAATDATGDAAAARVARLAVVSAADPVDRASGRLVHLPDSPFLVGELDPVAILAPYVNGPIVVDNDVNWAARAQPRAGADFAYLYLGEGLGCAVVHDGEVRRGGTGLAGEIAHLLTVGPDGRAIPFIDVFAELDLRQPGSTAIDVDRLLSDAASCDAVGAAVAGVIAAVVALADPEEVIVGGSWGPPLVDSIRSAAEALPRRVAVRVAEISGQPVLAGVRAEALSRLRAMVTSHS